MLMEVELIAKTKGTKKLGYALIIDLYQQLDYIQNLVLKKLKKIIK